MKSMIVSDEEGSEDDSDDEEVGPVEFDAGEERVLDTKKYGKLNFRAAEALLHNGGRSTIGTKSRKAIFTGDTYTSYLVPQRVWCRGAVSSLEAVQTPSGSATCC